MLPVAAIHLVALVAGALYGLLAVTLWAILQRRHPPVPLSLWVTGALLAGLALMLLGLNQLWPEGPVARLALHCLLGSLVLRSLALRHDLGLPLRLPLALGGWAAGSLLVEAAGLLPLRQPQLLVGAAVLVAAVAVFARHAAATGRALRSRLGHGLALAELLLALLVVVRTALLLVSTPAPHPLGTPWDLGLATTCAVLAALFGNLGYLGLVLERSRSAEREASATQLAERLRREAADDRAGSLRHLLQQRDELTAERDHLLKLLAHEIRQPLHNASGALQSARAELCETRPDTQQRAIERLQRAQSVLGEVRSVLDNTLAAANLLGGGEALYLPDTPLAPLMHQVLGDLPEALRRLVRVQWQDAPGTAELEPGLVRLALRNLLRNAFSHGGPAVSVVVQFELLNDPGALVISVVDDGVGPPPDWQPAVAAQPPRDGRPGRRRGLGLFIVREVMARHGGTLSLSPRTPHGMVARLHFPQRMHEAAQDNRVAA